MQIKLLLIFLKKIFKFESFETLFKAYYFIYLLMIKNKNNFIFY